MLGTFLKGAIMYLHFYTIYAAMKYKHGKRNSLLFCFKDKVVPIQSPFCGYYKILFFFLPLKLFYSQNADHLKSTMHTHFSEEKVFFLHTSVG